MTELQFQTLLHKLYQGDPDTPTSSEDDYTLRNGLLQAAIRDWENEEGVLWFELWKMNSDSQTQTTDGTTVNFNAPADFRFPGGFVRLTKSGSSTFYKVLKPSEIELHKNETSNYCWFTGNDSSGFVLHFLSAPASGYVIEYPYYKQATFPSTAGTGVLEMSNPMFAIRHVLSTLYELDGEGDKAVLELQRAGAALKQMKIRNEEPAFFQNNEVLDGQMDETGVGFGN